MRFDLLEADGCGGYTYRIAEDPVAGGARVRLNLELGPEGVSTARVESPSGEWRKVEDYRGAASLREARARLFHALEAALS